MYYKYYKNIKSSSGCPNKLSYGLKKSNQCLIQVLKMIPQSHPNVELDSNWIGLARPSCTPMNYVLF